MTDRLRDDLLAAMDYARQPSAVKQAFQPDPCCGPRLSKALRKGDLDTAIAWECPKCGCEWKPTIQVEGIRFWQPHPIIEVWRFGD